LVGRIVAGLSALVGLSVLTGCQTLATSQTDASTARIMELNSRNWVQISPIVTVPTGGALLVMADYVCHGGGGPKDSDGIIGFHLRDNDGQIAGTQFTAFPRDPNISLSPAPAGGLAFFMRGRSDDVCLVKLWEPVPAEGS
jgi:hypothetical protein